MVLLQTSFSDWNVCNLFFFDSSFSLTNSSSILGVEIQYKYHCYHHQLLILHLISEPNFTSLQQSIFFDEILIGNAC